MLGQGLTIECEKKSNDKIKSELSGAVLAVPIPMIKRLAQPWAISPPPLTYVVHTTCLEMKHIQGKGMCLLDDIILVPQSPQITL